ncbi:SGNH/GDSL hydrolase family protein [Pseudidiomarina gelatinasegens]|uniref:SGNH/GDSL hydrolase family protein n=1 Tax=Pseudidiomarina gelatinasegens TaxID=2487740 RepID=UPI0030EF54E6
MKKLLMLVLAPILLWQGKRVRRTTVRLPEASGKRAGVMGAGKSLRLLVLGDSAAAGVGCATQAEAVTGQLVQRLAETYRVSWELWAQSSLTCEGVCQLAEQHAGGVKFDVVLVSAGVNDVTRRTALAKWQNDLSALTQLLRMEFQAQRIVFTALPPMHKFPALPQPLRWFIGRQARELDTELKHHCQRHDCDYLALDLPFAAEYMAADGFHPSAQAARLWARGVSDLLQND